MFHGTKEQKQRVRSVLRKLKLLFPEAGMALAHKNHWQLLVAVELSAQCTDKKVNEVTKRLFKKYRTLESYLHAVPQEFEQDIYQTGFYRSKTKNILAAAKMVHDRFHGTLPRTMEEMLLIPGVGRKTANVVLGNAYGISEGIAVDTHVKRLVRVFGLTTETDVKKIERILMEIVPRTDWFHLTYLFIEYGRRYCPARKHDHRKCPLGHATWE